MAYAFVAGFSSTHGVLFQINVLVTPEQKLFYSNFLSADSVESVYNQGLNFAKFLLPPGLVYNCFVASEQKLFYGQLFVT